MHIGFIGLGRMGGHMASRLLDAGHTLTVMDLNDAAAKALTDRGAQRAATAKEVADACEVVFASLPSPPIVQETALGAAGVIHGSKIRTFVDLSTTGTKVSTIVYDGLKAKGIASLDAPVSGGVKGARDGTLAIMVGGPKASFDEYEDVLKVFGKVFYMGEAPGAGQTMKLVNNLISCATIAVTAEGMAMGARAGLDPQLMIDVLNVSTGASSATRDKWPRSVLPRTFDYGFATALAFKDLRLCLEEAEAMGVPMVVGSSVRQFMSITNQLYGPESDFTCMAKTAEVLAAIDADDPPFQALIFDVGGVIVPHDNDMLYARLASRCSVPDAAERIRGQSGKTGVGSGAISVQDLHRRMSDQLGYAGDWETFADDWCCHLGIDEAMLDVVERLAEVQRVALFSNTTDVHWARVEALSNGRISRLEQYLSHLIRAEKPSLEAFGRVAELGGFDPARCLFFDDVQKNVDGARAAGFQAELFTDQTTLESSLTERGVRWARQTQETV